MLVQRALSFGCVCCISPSHLAWCAQAQDARLGDSSRDVIRDINKHAAVVMQGLPRPGAGDVSDNDPDARLSRSREATASGRGRAEGLLLEDLRGPWVAGFSELRIQDPKRCYEGSRRRRRAAPPETGGTDAGRRRALAGCAGSRAGAAQRRAWPARWWTLRAAERVLSELCQRFQQRGPAAGRPAGRVRGGAAQQLVPQLQSVLRETVLTSNELLRHFWGAFPLTSAGTGGARAAPEAGPGGPV